MWPGLLRRMRPRENRRTELRDPLPHSSKPEAAADAAAAADDISILEILDESKAEEQMARSGQQSIQLPTHPTITPWAVAKQSRSIFTQPREILFEF